MFATLRRHQKWMWAGIIAVIIPSFVIFFSPTQSFQSEGGGNFGTINGRPISQTAYVEAYHEAQLRYYLQNRTWPDQDEAGRRMGFDLDRETRNRVLLIELLQAEQVHVSDQAVALWIANVFRNERQGGMRLELYDQFVKTVLPEKGMQERDLERFGRHEVGIQELIALHGLNGRFVTPREAEANYQFEHEQLDTEAVTFSASNYLAGVNLATNALAQFYTNRMAVYRIPARVQVSYVNFSLTNFNAAADQSMSQETNLTQLLNQIYQERGANYFTDTNGNVMPEGAAKEKIKEQVHRQYAMQAARKKAGAFAMDLFKMTPQQPENLEKLAATNHLGLSTTEPFTEYEGPRDLKVTDSFSRAAFALSSEEPFAPPVNGEEGVYVMGFIRKLPSEVPPLDTIKARVTEEYRRSQALQAALQAGAHFYQTLTNGLAQGKAFAALCAEAKVTPVPVPKFSLSSRSLPDLPQGLDLSKLREVSSRLTPGDTSPFNETREGGFVLHVRARLPVDPAEMKKDLPDYLMALRQSRQFEAFSDWMSRQISLARLAGPDGKSAAAKGPAMPD